MSFGGQRGTVDGAQKGIRSPRQKWMVEQTSLGASEITFRVKRPSGCMCFLSCCATVQTFLEQCKTKLPIFASVNQVIDTLLKSDIRCLESDHINTRHSDGPINLHKAFPGHTWAKDVSTPFHPRTSHSSCSRTRPEGCLFSARTGNSKSWVMNFLHSDCVLVPRDSIVSPLPGS